MSDMHSAIILDQLARALEETIDTVEQQLNVKLPPPPELRVHRPFSEIGCMKWKCQDESHFTMIAGEHEDLIPLRKLVDQVRDYSEKLML